MLVGLTNHNKSNGYVAFPYLSEHNARYRACELVQQILGLNYLPERRIDSLIT